MITARILLIGIFVTISLISGILREILVKKKPENRHIKECEFCMLACIITVIILLLIP